MPFSAFGKIIIVQSGEEIFNSIHDLGEVIIDIIDETKENNVQCININFYKTFSKHAWLLVSFHVYRLMIFKTFLISILIGALLHVFL
jgi:hypothetical protein